MSRDELLAGYLETGAFDEEALAALPADEQAEVRAEQAALDRLRDELGNDDLWAEPDDDLADRVLGLVLAEPAGTAPAPASAPAATAPPAAAPAGAEVVSLADARARRSRAVAIGASIVAAAAVVVAVVAFSTRSSGTGGDLASPPTTGPTTSSTAPVRELDVKGTELAPGAAGTVRIQETPSGVRIDLDVPGLERRDHGEFYQAWIRTPQGLVPIGTFHTGTDVTLWSGIELDDSLAITVTLEQNDGNQESSGQRVLLVPLTATPPGSTPPGSTASSTAGSTPSGTVTR